jgi:hypothetical protein
MKEIRKRKKSLAGRNGRNERKRGKEGKTEERK